MKITTGFVENEAQKVVVYGPEGIGKSTFASKFPNPYFIDTEGSTKRLNVSRFDKPSSWEMLKQQIDFVIDNKPCETLIIDTIDWAERLAIDYICDKSSKKSIVDFGYGEGFIKLEEAFGRFLNKLSDVIEKGINVVLIAHTKITKFEQPDEMGAYDRYELKLGNKTTAKTSSLVKEWADMILFANYKTYSIATDDKGKKHKAQGGSRVMYTSHHPCWDAKNRVGLNEEESFDYEVIAPYIKSNKNFSNQSATQLDLAKDVESGPKIYEPENQKETSELDGLPKQLVDLMKIDDVSVREIQRAVAFKKYFPLDTPILNYGKDFIDGCLIGAWKNVLDIIKNDRMYPWDTK